MPRCTGVYDGEYGNFDGALNVQQQEFKGDGPEPIVNREPRPWEVVFNSFQEQGGANILLVSYLEMVMTETEAMELAKNRGFSPKNFIFQL